MSKRGSLSGGGLKGCLIGILAVFGVLWVGIILEGLHSKYHDPLNWVLWLLFGAFPFVVAWILFKSPTISRKIVGLVQGKVNETKGKRKGVVSLYSREGVLPIGNPYRGIFVMGGAGSGKSESVAVPLLKQFVDGGFSGVVYDFKFPTLGQEVQNFVAAAGGIPHYYLDFANPTRSFRVNPLNPAYLLDSSFANEFAQAIIDNLLGSQKKDDYWNSSAVSVLTACILFLKNVYPAWCDVPHVFAMVNSPSKKLLDALQLDPVCANLVRSVYDALQQNASGQVAGVMGTLQNAVAKMNTPELMYVLGGDDFSLDVNNPEAPIILTVGSNPTLTKTIAPLAALVITVATKMMNQQGKRQSFVLLDEAPTLTIPNFSQLPATGRSNKIATVYMCQDFSQMVTQYGQEGADEIFANLNNHFYGRVASGKTAEMLSKQFGKEDETYVTRSAGEKVYGSAIFGSKSETVQERDVMRSNEFTTLPVGAFAGMVVGSTTTVFKRHFKTVERPAHNAPLTAPPEREADVMAFYKSVKSDIDELLGS